MLAAGLGGGVGSVFDFLVLVFLVEHSVASIPVSAFLAAGVGAVVCFVLNKYIAFRDRSPLSLDQIARFGMVAVATAFLTAFGMKLIAVDHGVAYPLAKALCAAAVFVTWTYPAQRRLVFRRVVAAI
jgi:putative flippase GtrA